MGELDDLFYDYDDFDGFEPDDRADDIRCNLCGEEDLHWETVDDERYVLSEEDGTAHRCKPDADGMEAL